MLAVMFTLNWRFTLVALAVTPLLLVFAVRLRSVVKQATRDVRLRQSEIVSIVQEGPRIHSRRQGVRAGRVRAAAARREERRERRGGAVRAPRALAARTGGDRAGRVRDGGGAVVRGAPGARRRDDGRRADRVHDVSRQAVPADSGSRQGEHEHRAGGGRPRAGQRGARRRRAAAARAECPRADPRGRDASEFRGVTFGYDPGASRARPTSPSSSSRASLSDWSGRAAAASPRSSA